ncbi:succinate dehydrogenase, cytochrome b556 subunit [Xylophilus rhododendri]|uniref:Succinate dehydrogenase cytochrome b556 subunit n=1 Tax=Xylophilus rhododendri TaxID=2697032 RepID=A0A857JC51_9BURK|nr:succinate dehydrogenase, cytochrome b556 subunit [Xylophilus rhododendri]QHJ00670.1 succinate dehydrogenase, cytochrome b556 subunit [Xylophilus rhododendri]
MAELSKKRPEFRNINALTDLTTYRLPAAGIVSILHRISGLIMFILLPLVIWMFDLTVSSEISFARFSSIFHVGIGGVILKLFCLALLWAYLHHFIAGLRHLWMDVNHHAVEKKTGQATAKGVLVLSVLLTVVLGAKLFGLY